MSVTEFSPSWSTSAVVRASCSADLPSAAAALASSGIPVFPCVPGAKQPLTSRGFLDATCELSRVWEWWRRTPDANIGVPTGGGSGVVVVDVDMHDAGSGFPAFEQARTVGLVGFWAWLVRTPSGGLHAYFPSTPGIEQRSWQVPAEHVDFRGDGGYVVVPPSRLRLGSGQVRRYEPIAVAQHQPQHLDSLGLRTLLDPPRPVRTPGSPPAPALRPVRLAEWVATRPEGARNHGLFWATCRMVEDGHPYDVALSILGEAARRAGLGEREVTTTIRSAYRNTSLVHPPRSISTTKAVEAVAL